MLKTTPLIIQHQLAGAKLVDFSGWQMPLHYGSQIQEHHLVRQDAGMFDVSHMAIVDVKGEEVSHFLRYLLANDVVKLDKYGKSLYTCMLNFQGGIIDDLIVTKLADDCYRLVLNAATREKDWAWLQEQQQAFKVTLQQREDLALIAIQGPKVIERILPFFEQTQQQSLFDLPAFQGIQIEDAFYSRTGYTGEDGFEVHIPVKQVNTYWQKFLTVGIKPCGLGARDTLRLEAGLNLYGTDMDESTTPLESNLAWTVAFDPVDRGFIGRAILEQQARTEHRQMVGIILPTAGVLRNHQKVLVHDNGEGEITSGSFSPTLGHAIALARIPYSKHANACEVTIRQKNVSVVMVKPPFVRKGKQVYKKFE
jgi:aminomethyltransferase